MMKLQKEEGFNPLGGCLPILLQAPVFLALFHVLRLIGTPAAGALSAEYGWTPEQVTSAGQATVFGAPIASAFSDPRDLVSHIAGASETATKVVAGVLIVLMVAATYITQRQIISRNTQVVDGQQAMIQKMLLYGMPASLTVSGFFFPIGVLFYWFTNNLWTMGQQFYIIKRMPHPNAKKDADKSAVDPKLLAPKPGQKPVRPRKGTPAVTAGTTAPTADGTEDGTAAGTADGTDATTVDGQTAAGTPVDGRPAKRKRGATAADPEANAAPPNGKVPTDGSAADGSSGDGTAPVAGDDGTGADAPTPPAPRPKSGSGARPGGARRPQGQRSPTQTRQKKKRR
jgi:YidC/Oxa1 family membrane protein insertase